jgi:DNA polymerase III epsilon subunit-like protein
MIYFDLETTERSPCKARIVQIGAVSADEKFETLVNPGVSISPGASKINKIYDKDVADSPKTAVALKQFFDWIRKVNGTHILAYNGINFDFAILFRECWRESMVVPSSLKFIDPLPWARKNLIELPRMCRTKSGRISFCLGDVYTALFSKTLDGAHDAMADAVGLRDVCESPECSRLLEEPPCHNHEDLKTKYRKSGEKANKKKKKKRKRGRLQVLATMARKRRKEGGGEKCVQTELRDNK